jgi:hypothetical protein
MVEPAEKRTAARRAKWLALATAGGSTLALGVVVASIGPKNLARGAWVAWKLERRTSKDEAYDCLRLARTRVPWARRVVERRLKSPHSGVRRSAMQALVEGFPESETARAVAEFQSISGEDYFVGWAKEVPPSRLSEKGTVDQRIARWESFVREHEDFPGRDDAGYRLARAYEEKGLPRDAFRTLVAALGWGDRDCVRTIHDRITNVLDAQCDLDDARALLAESDGGWRPLLEYSVAVKLAQARRFAEASKALDDFARENRERQFETMEDARREHYGIYEGCHEGCYEDCSRPQRSRAFEMLAWSPTYSRDDCAMGGFRSCYGDVDHFWSDVDRQRAVLADLARIDASRLVARTPRQRASAWLAMGERVLDEPHAFENLILHDTVLTNCHGQWNRGADEDHDDDRGLTWSSDVPDERMSAYVLARNHLIQAAGFLERSVCEDPFGPAAPRAAFLAARARLGVLTHHRDVAPTWGRRPGHDVCQALPESERRRLAGRASATAFAVAFARDPNLALAGWVLLDHDPAVSCARGSKPKLTELIHESAPARGEVALGR